MAFRARELREGTTPDEIRRELNGIQREIAADLAALRAQSPVTSLITDSTFTASYGQIVRMAPPSTGLRLILPPVNIAVPNGKVVAVVEAATGALSVEAIDTTINGSTTLTYLADIGTVEFLLTPSGWYAWSSSLVTVALTSLANQADDTFLANIAGSSAPPTAVALTTLAGAGLTGGADAILAVGAGTRITVNANDVQLATGAAESFLMNATASVATADYRAGSSVAGGGLTYTAGGTLAVGAGTGITVNANDIAWDGLMAEAASTGAVAAAQGRYWVRNDVPSMPLFTNDTSQLTPIQNGLAEQLTAASVSAATTVLATTQTYTIPANTLRVGSRFRCCYTYRAVRGATATATVLSSFFDVATFPSVSPSLSTTAGTYIVRVWAEMTVLSTGAGGTAMGSIMAHAASATGVSGWDGIASAVVANDSTSFALDTTAAIAMRGAAQMGTGVAATSITATGGHIAWIR